MPQHAPPATAPAVAAAPTLRRELFLSFGVLFAGAILVASLGLLMVLPVVRNAGETTFFIVCLLAADLAILFVFGGALLRRSLLEPMDRLVEDAARIAEGDYEHRVRPAGTLELRSLSEHMNRMAERLIREQRLLADNVRSLDETNRELVEAGVQVMRVGRLASVGTLAAGIAHEIGNPLGAIMAYVDVARRRVEEGGDAREAIAAAADEARRIDRIVQSLLDYARPDRERRGSDAVDPRVLLPRVLSLLEAQGQLQGIETTWSVEDDVSPFLGDAHLLEQILVNLLLNAVDALEGRGERRVTCRVREEAGEGRLLHARRKSDPPGANYAHRRRAADGRLVVEGAAGEVGVGDARPAPEVETPAEERSVARERIRLVVLTIEDNGPGIRPSDLPRLFDPFFTTKEPGKGTGLGLSICARLVEEMGGMIEAANVPGGGAAFIVRLPAVPPPTGLSAGDRVPGADHVPEREGAVR